MRIGFILALAFLPSFVLAYSNPGKPAGFVSDFAGVLTGEQRLQIENRLVEFKKSTGVEIAVVTIESLEGDTVENYASELFREWGIGEKGKDNGVLFLVAVEDHEMRIEVGYGLEGLLTDAQSYWIQQNVAVPAFRNDDFYSGISGVTEKIIAAVNQEEIIPSENPADNAASPFDGQFFGWLILVVPLWLARILGRSKSWWLGGVLGGVGGLIVGSFYGFLYTGVLSMALLVPIGLLFDFFVSRGYQKGKLSGHYPWWIGGGGGSGGGGGFGGFGGGGSGGGGSSSRW
ncbi:MAG: TPM domain-containing protein [bacterium]|nr:TPM domain-containing protein [bacterium]